jgi:hypothetical protein
MTSRYLLVSRSLALVCGVAAIACGKTEPEAKNPGPASVAGSASSATSSTPEESGCFCRRHKSDSDRDDRPLCKIGDTDYNGKVCEPGNPAEGPLPPPDLPHVA